MAEKVSFAEFVKSHPTTGLLINWRTGEDPHAMGDWEKGILGGSDYDEMSSHPLNPASTSEGCLQLDPQTTMGTINEDGDWIWEGEAEEDVYVEIEVYADGGSYKDELYDIMIADNAHAFDWRTKEGREYWEAELGKEYVLAKFGPLEVEDED